MSKRSQDVPGNAMASQAAFTKSMVRMGEMLQAAPDLFNSLDEEGLFLYDVKVTLAGNGRNDYLAVVRGETAEGKVVAFHNAPDFAGAIVGVLDRLRNRSLKFREDKPYGSK